MVAALNLKVSKTQTGPKPGSKSGAKKLPPGSDPCCIPRIGTIRRDTIVRRRRMTVADLTVQPTAKFLKAGTLLAAVVFLSLEVAYLVEWPDQVGRWVMVVPPLILLWPLTQWIKRRFTKATITGDRLRYESGFPSKSTRTIQLSKVQDVRVDQRMSQRIFGVGNISIETAGEASRLTLHNVDDPQGLADEILNRAQHGPAAAL